MHELCPMSFHRRLAGAELRGDLLVQQARYDQCHDLTLALRKRFVPSSQLGPLCPLMSCSAVTINRLLNGVEQLLVAKRFRVELHGSSLHALNRHWNVVMSGDDHDRDR